MDGNNMEGILNVRLCFVFYLAKSTHALLDLRPQTNPTTQKGRAAAQEAATQKGSRNY